MLETTDGLIGAQDTESGASALDAPNAEDPASGRDARGRFRRGNLAALTHGARSRQVQAAALPEQAAALAALAERRQAIERDRGGLEALSTLERDAIGRYLELCVIGDYLAANILAYGPLTTKGRQRAAVSAYLGVVDRQTKLATTIGLDLKARDLRSMSVEQWAASQRAGAEGPR